MKFDTQQIRAGLERLAPSGQLPSWAVHAMALPRKRRLHFLASAASDDPETLGDLIRLGVINKEDLDDYLQIVRAVNEKQSARVTQPRDAARSNR